MEEDIATRTPPGTSYHVGCASWLDTSLLAEGTFYPSPHMTAEERLRWYARFFEAVEVNATYYALPAYNTSRAWVGYSSKALEYLGSLSERLPGWTLAVEFRNPSWVPQRTAEVLKFLRDHRLVYVAVDCPWQPLIPEASADTAVMRLHGRNIKGWQAQMRGKQPSVAEKYDYLYSPEEVAALSETARSLEEEAATVHITFNNNNRDYPVRNGL